MKLFAQLFSELDQTNKTNVKIALLKNFFESASDKDKLWALALFSDKRPRRKVKVTLIREWAIEMAGIPKWLFDESYHVVGDLAETISLLLPSSENSQSESLTYWINYLEDLEPLEEADKRKAIIEAWQKMNTGEQFVFTKLITGGFRIGVSQKLVVKALSQVTGIEDSELIHKLMGKWHPDSISFDELVIKPDHKTDISRPYPFFLAHQLDDPPESLGNPNEWHAEWKWDGIRSQMIFRVGQQYIWSRGEELVGHSFPEFHVLRESIPDGTVLDGEVLSFKNGNILSFNALQTRLGRKKITKKQLEDSPVAFFAYDIMEWEGKDIRQKPLAVRRTILKELVLKANFENHFSFSPEITFDHWDQLREIREKSRSNSAEGLMLKRLNSPYEVGRKRGDWWKWKIEPFTVDAVMVYAQRGHGRRANLYTDFTLAVWNGDQLVPFTKSYSGLSDAEMGEVDRFVKKNTLERFGPMRTVKPELVFEIAFEGIQRSNRHKSGIALRFPRIKRWRKDLTIRDADTLEHLYNFLNKYF